MFITTTWRALDPQEHPESPKRLHLADGVWVDIDADAKRGQGIEDAVKSLDVTAKQLQNLGIPLECCSLFASGGKGFHVFIPVGLLIPGGVSSVGINTARWWPLLCREFVRFELISDCTDLKIYNEGRGRIFRQPHVLRSNGRFKVALDWTEYQNLTTDAYKALCAAPRPLLVAREVLGAAPTAAIAWRAAFKRATGPKAISTKPRKPAMKLDSRGHMFSADRRNVDRALKRLQRVDLDYSQWLSVGMALKSTGASDALEMWDKFSKGHPGYRKDDCSSRWGDFRTGDVGLGTLYLLASKGGAA